MNWLSFLLAAPSGRYLLVGILLILLGIANAAAPRVMWRINYGWRYKDAEPSNTALLVSRVGGVIAIAAGIVFLFL